MASALILLIKTQAAEAEWSNRLRVGSCESRLLQRPCGLFLTHAESYS